MCVSQLLSRRLLAGWTLALLITIAATVGVMWVLQRPVHRIVSSSMAPHWLGPHIEFPCDDCGYHLHLDTSLLTVATPLRCPNCAHELGDLPRRLSRGDAIDVRAWRPEERPARWQTVVFRSDNGLESLEMKRIVGLPGEVVSIVAGDVLVDGLRPTRSLQQFRDMAVPVYDDRFRAQRTKSPDRWVPVEMNTRWQVVPDGLRCEGGKDAINESLGRHLVRGTEVRLIRLGLRLGSSDDLCSLVHVLLLGFRFREWLQELQRLRRGPLMRNVGGFRDALSQFRRIWSSQ